MILYKIKSGQLSNYLNSWKKTIDTYKKLE